MKSHSLHPQLLSDYAFLHYNYKYDWLRPKLEEIVCHIVAACLRLYDKESRDSDNESDGSDGTGGLDEEAGEQVDCTQCTCLSASACTSSAQVLLSTQHSVHKFC
jgi:hypothetical protein